MKEINGKMKLTEEEISRYIDEANDILKNAYVPYSKFPVAALLIDEQGRKFRGVNVENASYGLGICAERNAIFNMITNSDNEVKRVLAIMSDGKTGAPCGACRELMTQLMPKSYQHVEIMLDYKKEKVVTLGELTPEWWI